MPRFLQVTPFLHVADLEAAVAFYTGLFGFQVFANGGNYAYLQREAVGLRIMSYKGDDAELPKGDGRWNVYIDVADVNALYQECKPKLDALPRGSVEGPLDQPYGQRELMVKAPDGNVLVFGQALTA
ncbi:MAG TPA: VOC family protein [Acidobacteriaceae bacterium]|jgi:catechol 2,3-dioxygenase-like lactoylglutathione lyase family enzyme|nr:VOC family protein [Acidobacteriaceae bacterium]